MHDVIVIGAGPSGLNTAQRLAGEGLRVMVLEKKKEVGKHIVCTGIVGADAFREFDLADDSIMTEIKSVKMVSPFKSSFSYGQSNPMAYVVEREKFDKNLAVLAQSKGAEINFNCQVMDIDINKNYAEIVTKGKNNSHSKYRSKLVLVATGVDHSLNKKIDLGYSTDFLNGAQTELESPLIDKTTIFVGKNIAPGGFAWAVPLGEKKAKVGLLTKGDPKSHFKNFHKFLFASEINSLDTLKIQYKAIAQGLATKTYRDRALTIGEAAGQVKTTTGGGIYFGLMCSKIASNIILKAFEKNSFTSNTLSEYEKLWKKAIQKEIVLGYYARKMYEKMNDSQIEKMFEIANTDGLIPLIKEKGDFNWHSELIFAILKRTPFLKILKHPPHVTD